MTAGKSTVSGESPASRRLRDDAERLARAPWDLLILTGEPGSGREHVARAIHDAGERHDQTFGIVECSQVPDSVIESVLFGSMMSDWVRGPVRRAGVMEQWGSGTLLLADAQALRPATFDRIVRAVREMRVQATSQDQYVGADIRVMAATSEEHLNSGEFEGLALTALRVPPLRERADDIALLASELAREIAGEHEMEVPRLADGAIDQLKAYGWPGNVRELRNVIERTMFLSDGKDLDFGWVTSKGRVSH